MKRVLASRRGSILIAVTFMMLVLVLMGITGVAMLVNQAHTSINVMRIAEASAARHGIGEFLQRRLQYDLDWSNIQNETITFGPYTTEVEYSKIFRNSMSVSTVTSDADGRVVRRQTFAVERVPTSMRFSVFNNDATGTTLFSNAQIDEGDVYNKGSVVFTNGQLGATVDVYSSINNGTSGLKVVADPQPKMPNYDPGASAAKIIPELDADIADAIANVPNDPSEDLIVTASMNLTGETIVCRNLIVRGSNVVISGKGKIIASQNIYLQDETASSCSAPKAGDYVSSDGGCKKIGNPNDRLVWHEARPAASWTDAQAFCASDGKRLPSESEMQNAAGSGVFKFDANQDYWQSLPEQTVNMQTGAATDHSSAVPAAEMPFVCVRTASASSSQNNTFQAASNSGGGGILALAAGGSIYKTDDLEFLTASATSSSVLVMYARSGPLHLTSSRYAGSVSAAQNAVLISRSKIYLGPAMRAQRSVLYAPDGLIQIDGNGSADLHFTGVIASMSEQNPAVRITGGINAEGVIYVNGGENKTGTLEISDVTGQELTILTNGFYQHAVQNLHIAHPYAGDDVMPGPATTLEGFTGTVSREQGSWTGD